MNTVHSLHHESPGHFDEPYIQKDIQEFENAIRQKDHEAPTAFSRLEGFLKQDRGSSSMGQSTQSTVTQVCDVSRLLDQALNPHAGPCTIPEQQIYRAEGDLALQGDPGLQSGGHSLQLRSGELDPKRFVGKSVITVDKVDHGLKQNTELQFFAYSSAYDLMAPAEQLDEEARVLENNGNLNFHLIKLLNSGHEGYTWEPQLW